MGGGVAMFLVASCHGSRNKLRVDGLLGPNVDLILLCCRNALLKLCPHKNILIRVPTGICLQKYTDSFGSKFICLS